MQDRDHGLIIGQGIGDNVSIAGHAFLVGACHAAGMAGCEIAKRGACFPNAPRDLRRSVGIIGGNMGDLPP